MLVKKLGNFVFPTPIEIAKGQTVLLKAKVDQTNLRNILDIQVMDVRQTLQGDKRRCLFVAVEQVAVPRLTYSDANVLVLLNDKRETPGVTEPSPDELPRAEVAF